MSVSLVEIRDSVARHLKQLMTAHRVPGAVVGLSCGGRNEVIAHGLLNVTTGEEVTPDSLFQIGSITKVLTATMVMQLVDAGKLALSDDLGSLLPGVAGLEHPRPAVTLEQLLCHMSGIDGDYFVDTGRGDDCVEKFLRHLPEIPQLHAPGQMFSYSNSSYVLAGAIVERTTGQVWHKALQSLLLEPVQMRRTFALPEEAMRFRTAVGHSCAIDGCWRVVDPLLLPRSNEPAGSTPWSSMEDLLSFGRLHLYHGLACTGSRILSARSAGTMRQRRTVCPPYAPFSAWGLGWALFDWGGRELFGHDGLTRGQASFLRIDPASGLMLGMFANGGDMRGLFMALIEQLVDQRLGFNPPAPPQAGELRFDLDRYVGAYDKASDAIEIACAGGALRMSVTPRFDPPGIVRALDLSLQPVCDGVFMAQAPGARLPLVLTFSGADDGASPRYAHLNLRAYKRRVER
ncbi:MAG TPA: serine hydrolase domain-containing protein [Steroidobacter sp.]|uniref:serine hydrolase domain-containing protein n=1 Tax=Steroidobacter sp. TaxID=1978227 RepID=UPI002ED8E337